MWSCAVVRCRCYFILRQRRNHEILNVNAVDGDTLSFISIAPLFPCALARLPLDGDPMSDFATFYTAMLHFESVAIVLLLVIFNAFVR